MLGKKYLQVAIQEKMSAQQDQIAEIAVCDQISVEDKVIKCSYLNLRLCYLKILYAGDALGWPGAKEYYTKWDNLKVVDKSSDIMQIKTQTKVLNKLYKATIEAYAKSKRHKGKIVSKTATKFLVIGMLTPLAGFVVSSILIKALVVTFISVPFVSMLVAHPLVLVPALLGLVIAGMTYIAYQKSKVIPQAVKQAYVEIQEYAHDQLPRELFQQRMLKLQSSADKPAVREEMDATSLLVSTREWLCSDGSDVEEWRHRVQQVYDFFTTNIAPKLEEGMAAGMGGLVKKYNITEVNDEDIYQKIKELSLSEQISVLRQINTKIQEGIQSSTTGDKSSFEVFNRQVMSLETLNDSTQVKGSIGMMTSFRAKGQLRPAPANFSRMDLVIEGQKNSERFRLTGYGAGTPLGNEVKSSIINRDNVVKVYTPVMIRFARDYAKRYNDASDAGKKLMLAEGIVFNLQSLLIERPAGLRIQREEFFSLLKDPGVQQPLYAVLKSELTSKVFSDPISKMPDKDDACVDTDDGNEEKGRISSISIQVDFVPMSFERVVVPWREDVYQTAQANLNRFIATTLNGGFGLQKFKNNDLEFSAGLETLGTYLKGSFVSLSGIPSAIPTGAIEHIVNNLELQNRKLDPKEKFTPKELETMRIKLMAAVDLKRKMHRSVLSKALCKMSSWKVRGCLVGLWLTIFLVRFPQFVGLPLAAGFVATALGATPLMAISAAMAMFALTVLVPMLSSRRLCNRFSGENWRLNFVSIVPGVFLGLVGAAFIVLPFVFGGSFAAAASPVLLATTALPFAIGVLTLFYTFFSFGGQQSRYMSMSADSHILADGFMTGCKTARNRFSIFYVQMKWHLKRLHDLVRLSSAAGKNDSKIKRTYATTDSRLRLFLGVGVGGGIALVAAVALIIMAASTTAVVTPIVAIIVMMAAVMLLGVSFFGMQRYSASNEWSYLDAKGIDEIARQAVLENVVGFSSVYQESIIKVRNNLGDLGQLRREVAKPFEVAANVKKYKEKLGLASSRLFQGGFLLLTVAVVVTAVIPAANIASLILIGILVLLGGISFVQASSHLSAIEQEMSVTAADVTVNKNVAAAASTTLVEKHSSSLSPTTEQDVSALGPCKKQDVVVAEGFHSSTNPIKKGSGDGGQSSSENMPK